MRVSNKVAHPTILHLKSAEKTIMQNFASYKEKQDTLALLRLLVLSNRDVAAGRVKPLAVVVKRLLAKKLRPIRPTL
jgi:hypothetical protein